MKTTKQLLKETDILINQLPGYKEYLNRFNKSFQNQLIGKVQDIPTRLPNSNIKVVSCASPQ